MSRRILGRAVMVVLATAVAVGAHGAREAAAPALSPSAQDYIKLRAKMEAVVNIPLQELRTRLHELRGKVVELAGTIIGTMSRRGEAIEGKKLISFLLNDGKTGSAIVQCTEGLAEVRSQNRVRVLVRLDADTPALDFVPMLAIVREADLPKQWREQTGERSPGSLAGERRASSPSHTSGASSTGPPASVGPEMVTTVRTPTMPNAPDQPRPTLSLDTPNFEQIVDIYANLICLWNSELTPAERDLIARCILVYSPQYKLDHRLIFAMVACESSFNPLATSPKGARGLGQLMPGTAAGLGVSDSYNIEQNLRGAIRYLSTQIHRYAGRSNYDMFCLGMASYNAGPNRVAKAGRVPNIPETIRYVNRVAKLFKELHDKGYP